MATLTAVELGADTCAFARIGVRGGEVHLHAAEVLEPAAFPGIEAFTTAVRRTRRSMRLPRRCRAIVWGLPDGANRKDAAVKPLLEPLTNAGFRVERVVSPCNALAALARLKTSRLEGSTCWIAINRGGVAIVVVRPGKLLYAHSFAWDSTIGATGSQARLLQRYSLVAFLSPEIKRAMAEAAKSGAPVDAVVTCGNLPELRSLTMPLIEELDVEVETLDSLEGLIVKPAVVERLGESAASIRLACAAAIARGTRAWDPSRKRSATGARRYAQAALFAGVALGLGYWYLKMRLPPAPTPVTKVAVGSPLAQPKPPAPAVSTPATVAKSNPPAVTTPANIAKPTPPAASTPATVAKSAPPAVSVPAKNPESNPKDPKSNPLNEPVTPQGTTPARPANPDPRPANPPAGLPTPGPRPQNPDPRSSALNTPAVTADKPGADSTVRAFAPARTAVARGPLPALLKDAVPRVTAILVSRDRRFATVEGGQIVGIGDLIGRRTVVAMDERSVLLQEPSGARIRIGLGGRLLGVERVNR